MKVKEFYSRNKTTIHNVLFFILICTVYFLCMLKYINEPQFDTDELDIFAGGQAIAKGYVLYRDYMSQHMPFSYYFSALFWVMGARSVLLQRISFYAFFALLWTVMLFRYRRVCSSKALTAFPIIYAMSLSLYNLGHAILSEHIAGIGYVIFILEFLSFLKTEKLKIDNYIAISVALVLTFGTYFVSLFGVFAIFCGVIIKEISIQRREKRSFTVFIKYLSKRYFPLLGCCAVPWVILGVYYAIIGNLRNAIFWMYTFNRTYYSNYLGGYGDSVFQAMLKGVDNLFSYIQNSFINIFGGQFDFRVLSQTFILILALVYIILLFFKKKPLLGSIIVFLLIEALSRKTPWDYHSSPSVAIIVLMASFMLFDVIFKPSEHAGYGLGLRVVFALFSIVFIAGNYLSTFTNITRITLKEEKSDLSNMIALITDENESIWDSVLARNGVIIGSGRPEVMQAGQVPWFWDAAGEEILEGCKDDSPRVSLFDRNQSVWNHSISEYAPDLVEYMDTHYTQYLGELYIRNDYFDEAAEVLNDYNNIGVNYYSDKWNYIGEMADGTVYDQHFELIEDSDITSLEYYTATYDRSNDSKLEIQLYKGDTCLDSCVVEASSMTDNVTEVIYYEQPIHCEPGDYYYRFTALGVNEDLSNSITMGQTEYLVDDEDYCVVNGENMGYNLLIRVNVE